MDQAAAPNGLMYRIQPVKIDQNTSGDHVLVAAVAGKTVSIVGLNFVCTGANTITWKSSGGSTLVPGQSFGASGGNECRPKGIFCTSVLGEGITINLSASSQVSGVAEYIVY